MEAVIASNEAYIGLQDLRAIEQTQPLTPSQHDTVALHNRTIEQNKRTYRQVGNSTVATLAGFTADDPDYHSIDFYPAVYDALISEDTASNESVNEIARRALHSLVQATTERNKVKQEVKKRALEADYALCQGVLDGDRDAQSQFIAQYRRLVWNLAKREEPWLTRGVVGIEDLYQEGMLQALKACQRFDPGRNTRFSTFIIPDLLECLSRTVQAQYAVSLPEGVYDIIRSVRTLNNIRLKEGGHPLTTKEIAEEFNLEPEGLSIGGKRTVEDIFWYGIRLTVGMDSIDAGPLPARRNTQTVDYRLDEWRVLKPIDNKNLEPLTAEERATQHLLRRDVIRALKQLAEAEDGLKKVEVLVQYFGLAGENPRTLEEIASDLTITPYEANQRLKGGLSSLRSLRFRQILEDTAV